jgi:arsenate reductase-like glutaredoxin family protein
MTEALINKVVDTEKTLVTMLRDIEEDLHQLLSDKRLMKAKLDTVLERINGILERNTCNCADIQGIKDILLMDDPREIFDDANDDFRAYARSILKRPGYVPSKRLAAGETPESVRARARQMLI